MTAPRPSTAPPDQATRDLVSRDGLRRTLFVEAGAGTGKTTQLVDRIANLVLHEGVRLANIAAITFTEAAAAELQTRIRVQFEKRAATATDEAERERCRQAITDIDLAALSTLHGFASRLLGEFAIAAGLPPRIRVLDEVSSQLAHEDRWARFVDALYDDPANEPALVRAALVGVAFEPRYPGHATLKDVAAELNDSWDRLTLVAAAEPQPIGPVDFTAFDAAVAAVVDLADTCTDPSDKFCVHLTQSLIPQMTAVAAIADPDRKLAAIHATREWKKGSGGKKDAWGGDVVAAKSTVDAVNDAIAELIGTCADEVLRHLIILISAEVLRAAQARREDGGLEFHDLLVLAREVLRTSPEARSRLHERYSHILLDEFQDTDPIQIELALLIAASISGPVPSSWDQFSVDEGRIFFVGDPKQSIYRFRRADIGLFLEARDKFGPDDTWARLTTNFRTVAPILDWVNAFFGETMQSEEAGRQPRYEPLHAWRDADSGADHRPLLLGGPHPDPKVRAGTLREAEAADVARTIAEIRDRPDDWPVQDDTTKSWRPARLSDVTVLSPTRTSVPYLRAALEQAGIPYRLATGTLVYDTQEVRDALAALRAVDDPTDELSLVTALRSPLYACSDVDLFTYHQAGGHWDLRAEPPPDLGADHPVSVALAHLRTLWEQRWWLTPSTVLERLLRERRAFLLAFGHPRPTEVWRRLRFLLDQARAFEEANGGDLRSFVEWATLQGADSARVHEPLLPETDDDAVRILTIHGSKGLEFAITILTGMTTQPGGARVGVSMLWGDDGQPDVRIRKGIATANHEPRADLELEMDAHEKLRLFYVASTRARDHLVVSVHHKEGGPQTYANRVWTYFTEHPELWRARAEDPPVIEQLDLLAELVPPTAPSVDSLPAVDDRQAWIEARTRMLDSQQAPRVLSATAVARAAVAARSDDAALVDDDGFLDDLDPPEADEVDAPAVVDRRRGRAGTAVGRAVHATLQVIDLAEPVALSAQVLRQCQAESIPELADLVAKLVGSALASPTIALAATTAHHRELYVAAPVGSRVVEGYIDLLIETPEGLVVVDYKTDAVRSEADIDAKLAAYELQGASYAVALQAVTGLKVTECRFVFCRPNGAVERAIGGERLAQATARVVELVDVAGT